MPAATALAAVIAQQRKGEYSPFKATLNGVVSHGRDSLNKGRGNTPPSSRGWKSAEWRAAGSLNKGRGNTPPSSVGGADATNPAEPAAQQRKGEYSPFKSATSTALAPLNKGRGNTPPSRDRDVLPSAAFRGSAQQRKGEYSPFKATTTTAVISPVVAQQRKGEYSPFKGALGDHRLESVRERSTKEGGILPLQVNLSRARPRWWAVAQQRKGEYSPFKADHWRDCSRPSSSAQQRKGEYSPFKPYYHVA